MMEISRAFVLRDDVSLDAVTPRLTSVMLAHGFSFEGRHPSVAALRFERGSWARTVMALNPSQWRVRAQIAREPVGDTTCLVIKLDICTTGQLVTPAERDYFVSLIQELHQQLHAATYAIDPHTAMVLYSGANTALVKSALAQHQNAATLLSFGLVLPTCALMASMFGVPWFVAAGGGFLVAMLFWNAFLFSTRR